MLKKFNVDNPSASVDLGGQGASVTKIRIIQGELNSFLDTNRVTKDSIKELESRIAQRIERQSSPIVYSRNNMRQTVQIRTGSYGENHKHNNSLENMVNQNMKSADMGMNKAA